MDNREISRQLQQLEAYITSVVAALSRKELPVNIHRVVQIFDTTFSQIPSVLDLSEAKFVEIYNDVPNVLMAYALDATLSEGSYRQSDRKITFNRFPQGNYWIIHYDRISGDAWLVPNPLRPIAFDRLKSIEFCFERDFMKIGEKDLVVLVAPAIVQLLPISEPLTWKLIKPGKLSNQAGMPQNKIDRHELTTKIQAIVAQELAKLQLNNPPKVTKITLPISNRVLAKDSISIDTPIDVDLSISNKSEPDKSSEMSFGDLWRQSLSE
jgi:hypothetical protein